jgi:hypothetical protein
MVSRFVPHLMDFVRREDGPTAVEYAVMLALIILVCIGAITTWTATPTQPSPRSEPPPTRARSAPNANDFDSAPLAQPLVASTDSPRRWFHRSCAGSTVVMRGLS